MLPFGLAATVVQAGPPAPVIEAGTTVTEAVLDAQHPVSHGMPVMRSAAVGQMLPQDGASQFGVHLASNVVGLAGQGPTVEQPPSAIVVASSGPISGVASWGGDWRSVDESMGPSPPVPEPPPLEGATSKPGEPPLPESRSGAGVQKPLVQVRAPAQPFEPQVPRQIPGVGEAPEHVAS